MSRRLGAVLFCLLAPLALLFPWAVVPDHLGIAVAGWSFFREWLTKHPNLGPINFEVGAGIACLVLSSALPFVAGIYVVVARPPAFRVLVALLAATLVVFVPVFVRLDRWMWLATFGSSVLGHPTVGDCGGAALRTLALANTLAALFIFRRKAQNLPW